MTLKSHISGIVAQICYYTFVAVVVSIGSVLALIVGWYIWPRAAEQRLPLANRPAIVGKFEWVSPCKNVATATAAERERLAQFDHVPAQLGGPIDCIRSPMAASIGEYDYSMFIWFDKHYYILPHAKGDWWTFTETSWCIDDWCRDDRKWEEKFNGKIPKNRHAPKGGIAKYLQQYPSETSKFGSAIWVCQLNGGEVFVREYENGLVFGVYPSDPNNMQGNLFILYNDRHWEPMLRLNVTAPKCGNGSIPY